MQEYFFSKDFLETLNLRALNRFSLDQDFSKIYLTCSSKVPELEKDRPKCLWYTFLCMFIAALRSPAGKGYASWLSHVYELLLCFSLYHVVSWVRC